jgi:hypothetical protein
MGNIDNYHKWLEEVYLPKRAAGDNGKAHERELLRVTENIREVPSKVGLALTGLRLTFVAVVFVFTFYILLRVFALPQFNYIVEKRLGDHYRTHFSEHFSREDGIPQAKDFLHHPYATDMDQDGKRIYLATRGHGIQALHKDDSLWTTHDEKSTKNELPNDIKAIQRQQTADDKRLWALGFDGSITLGSLNGDRIDFRSLYAAGAWRYITPGDISTTHLVNNRYFILGTHTKGAGVYDINDHQWQDFKEIRDQSVKKILYKGGLLWFLTNRGVFVYMIEPRKGKSKRLMCSLIPDASLEVTGLTDIKVYSATHALAITSDRGCYLFQNKWSGKFLGGTSIPGLTQEAITFALNWHDWILVMGEAFGIAAYNPVNRNWSVIKSGPLPS